MNEKCIRCGGKAAYPVRALEVRTLHVRSFAGESRVQALGEEVTSCVCEACTRAQLGLATDPLRAAKSQIIPFAVVFAAGILVEILAFVFVKESRQVFILLGLAALICGVLGIWDAVKKAKEKGRASHARPFSFSFRNFPTPEMVPPVPTPATKTSTLPSVCSQISGPVVR